MRSELAAHAARLRGEGGGGGGGGGGAARADGEGESTPAAQERQEDAPPAALIEDEKGAERR